MIKKRYYVKSGSCRHADCATKAEALKWIKDKLTEKPQIYEPSLQAGSYDGTYTYDGYYILEAYVAVKSKKKEKPKAFKPVDDEFKVNWDCFNKRWSHLEPPEETNG